ncbi:uncharacterized protein LOC114326484 [Diabrotica virgifera virgifera]|uniref:Uncharacterized protein n=1 Tax=Diabrotica virgifera virgifera TaxID=50390 RepID=A0ABM5IDX1_DIAVI|nr:uncharacterized protein LOC114326484 [Diabrotica virgifera virgifera]
MESVTMDTKNFTWYRDEAKWTKIIIPSGTMDPNQSTVIQIPEDLQHNEVIIARNAQGQDNGGEQSNEQYNDQQQFRPCPAVSREQENFEPSFEQEPQVNYQNGPTQRASTQPPQGQYQSQNGPLEQEDPECDNMLELTTEKEAEILSLIKETDRERGRLYVLPINKKIRLMEQMEYIETGVVRRDLKEFQETRRKLVFDLQSLLSTLPNVRQTVRAIDVRDVK